MKPEVGKVYKCGDTFVYIEYNSQKMMHHFRYIGIECNERGFADSNSKVGRFDEDGQQSDSNAPCLRFWLEELPKRETITIGSSVYYKDEFEAAVKHLKEVKQ